MTENAAHGFKGLVLISRLPVFSPGRSIRISRALEVQLRGSKWLVLLHVKKRGWKKGWSGFMHQCKGGRVYEEVAEDGTELFKN